MKVTTVILFLTFVGDALFWIWSLLDGISNFILRLAGFPQDDEEGTPLPNWVGWTAMMVLLSAVGVWIYSMLR